MIRTTVVLLVVVIVMSAYFIWPTPDTYPLNRNPSVRLNRFTHTWQKFDNSKHY